MDTMLKVSLGMGVGVGAVIAWNHHRQAECVDRSTQTMSEEAAWHGLDARAMRHRMTPVTVPLLPYDLIQETEERRLSDLPAERCSRTANVAIGDTISSVMAAMCREQASCALVWSEEVLVGTVDWLSLCEACVVGGTHRVRDAIVPLEWEYASGTLGKVSRRLKRGIRFVVIQEHPTNEVIKVVSQASLLRWIPEKGAHADRLRDLPLSHLGPEALHTCRCSESTRDAFLRMARHGVSSLPVLDDQGAITGVLSVSDLRIGGKVSRHTLELYLAYPVAVFLNKFVCHSERPSTVVLQRQDSAWDVLTNMCQYQIHHVYVVEDARARRPCSVVSCGDILRVIF